MLSISQSCSPSNPSVPAVRYRQSRTDLKQLQVTLSREVLDPGLPSADVISKERKIWDVSLALLSSNAGFYKDPETNVAYSLQRDENRLLGGSEGFGESGELRLFYFHKPSLKTEVGAMSMAEKADAIYLVRGCHDTRQTWLYLLVAPSEKSQFLRELDSPMMSALFKPMHLENRGVLLFAGYGENPPYDVSPYLQRRYGKASDIPEVGDRCVNMSSVVAVVRGKEAREAAANSQAVVVSPPKPVSVATASSELVQTRFMSEVQQNISIIPVGHRASVQVDIVRESGSVFNFTTKNWQFS